MADNQEKSDDLIAELAKLMASNAQGSETEAKPGVIKLTPLTPATTPAPAVRIPGMDAGAAGTVRIPGLDPAAAPEEVTAATLEAEAATSAETTDDAVPAPSFAEGNGDDDVAPPTPAAEAPPAPATVLPPTSRLPDLGFNHTPEAPAAPSPDATPGDAFNFDFGFGAPAAPGGTQDASTASDPIADLIAAEFDANATPADPHPVSGGEPAPTQLPGIFGRTNAVAPPVDQPPRGPVAGDRFSTAPVFGLGNAPAAAPTPSRSDPIDEIEDLIGEAVRVQLSGAEGAEPQAQDIQPAAPVVPPLNTGFAPRRADLKDLDRASLSAEAAILAAAAATGAEVGRIQAPETDEHPYKRMTVKPPNTSVLSGPMRQYIGMGFAALLLLAAGFGLYSVLGMGAADPESAPVLTADTSPVKEAPATPPATTAEAPRSVVFDEIDGVDAAAGNETLVSRDQTAGSSVAEVASVAASDATDSGNESGLANRKVRTVTVRPDGTIVSADDAIAGTEALPVDRPNVPELPGAVPPSDLLAAATETVAAGAANATAAAAATGDPIASIVARANETADAAPTELAALTPATEAPVVFDGGLAAPIPMPRPVDRNALNNGSPRRAAVTPTAPQNTANAPASIPLVSVTQGAAAATPAAPAPAATGNSAAYVQLASLPTEADARSQSAAMQSRWSNLLGGQSLVVQRAELSGGRVTYRVRLPAASLQGATEICASIKANGGDCFAANS